MADETRSEPGALSGWQPGLVLLLALLAIPRAVDEVLLANVAPMLTPIRSHEYLQFVNIAIEVGAFILAGLAIDQFRASRVACLSLVIWAVLTALAAGLLRAPLLLFIENACAVAAGVFFGLVSTTAAKTRFPMTRRARILALLNLAAITCLLAGPVVLPALHWPPNPARAPAWAESGGLAITGFAMMLALVLWPALQQTEEPARTRASIGEALALLRRPSILPLILVMACHLLALSTLYRILFPYIVLERSLPRAGFMTSVMPPLVAYALAQIAFAAWSDARIRSAHAPGAARAPFIVLGGLCGGAIGLIPLVPIAWLVVVYGIVAIGMAAFPLVFTLGLDFVPASLAGRFLGLATAVVLAVVTGVFVTISALRPTDSMAWYFYFSGIAAVVAAAIAFATLHRLEPIEEGSGVTGRLREIFT